MAEGNLLLVSNILLIKLAGLDQACHCTTGGRTKYITQVIELAPIDISISYLEDSTSMAGDKIYFEIIYLHLLHTWTCIVQYLRYMYMYCTFFL